MHKLNSGKFLLIAALNIGAAICASIFLGFALGWLATGREEAGFFWGDILPFFQFVIFAAMVDHIMWAMASQNVGGKIVTRLPRLALQIASFLIYAVLIAAAINLVFHQSLTTILGASGVLGLVLGFALRGLVADIFSGIALQLDRSMSVGEWLDFQHRGRDMSGKLLEIAWRTVVFADRAENIILIPNGEFANLVIVNRSRPTRWTEFGSGIDLGAEHDEVRIRAVLQGALNKTAQEGAIASNPAPYVRISSIKDGGINFRMLYCIDAGSISPVKVNHLVLVNALQFLKAAGIPVVRTQHTDVAPPANVSTHHIDQPQARLAMLGSVRFLSILPPNDLATVAAEVQTLRLQAGHQLIQAGEPGDSMFVVSEGGLAVTIDKSDGPVIVGRLWPGDCFGEMSLFTGEPRSANIQTTEPTVLFVVKKETMAAIFAHNPSLVERIAELIDARHKTNDTALHQVVVSETQQVEMRSVLSRIRRFFHVQH